MVAQNLHEVKLANSALILYNQHNSIARRSEMPIPSRHEVSAGGIVYRRRKGKEPEILLILVPYSHGDTWTLPKGHVEKGETPEQAAEREVREETGIEAKVEMPLETVDYWFFSRSREKLRRVHKDVHQFLLRAIGGDVSDHNDEVLEARWVPVSGVEKKLSFESDKKALAKARRILLAEGEG